MALLPSVAFSKTNCQKALTTGSITDYKLLVGEKTRL